MNQDITESLLDRKDLPPDSMFSESVSAIIRPKTNLSMHKTVKVLVTSAFPMMLTYVMRYLVQLVIFNFLKTYEDDVITGAYGIGNTFLNVVCVSIIISLNVGLLTRMAQALGKGRLELMGYYFHRGLVINSIVQIALSVIIYFSDRLFELVDYPEDLARHIRMYLLYNLPSNFLFMIFHTCNFYLVACKIFRPAAYFQVFASCAGAAMGYYLLVMQKWGLEGAALANATMNSLVVLMIIIYICMTKPIPASLFWPNSKSFSKLWDLFKHQVLVGSMIFVEWVGVEIVGLASGLLSADQTAAYTATYSSFQPFYTVPITLSNTLLTFIGASIGEDNPEQAKKFLGAGIFLSMVAAVTCIGIFASLAKEIAGLILQSQEAIDDSVKMIYIYLICIPADFMQIVMGSGLRAIGRESIGFKILAGCVYCVGIPLAFFLCFYLGWEMSGLVWGLNAAFYLIFIFYSWAYARTSWTLQATKVNLQIDKESILTGKQERFKDSTLLEEPDSP